MPKAGQCRNRPDLPPTGWLSVDRTLNVPEELRKGLQQNLWVDSGPTGGFEGVLQAFPGQMNGLEFDAQITQRTADRHNGGVFDIHLPCYASENAHQPCERTPFLPTNSADDP